METVVIAYAQPRGEDKFIVGVYKTPEIAAEKIKKQGYGLTDSEAELLAILKYTVNRDINFKLEIWQVH